MILKDKLDGHQATLQTPRHQAQRRIQLGLLARPIASLRRDSGYEQPEAEVCRVEGDEVAVAFGPPA